MFIIYYKDSWIYQYNIKNNVVDIVRVYKNKSMGPQFWQKNFHRNICAILINEIIDR